MKKGAAERLRPSFFPKRFERLHELFRKNSFEPPRLVLIVQQDDRDNTQVSTARAAVRNFPLQILQEAVRKAIERALAPRRLAALRAAMGTRELDLVLQRIAVERGPGSAPHADHLLVNPSHRNTSFHFSHPA